MTETVNTLKDLGKCFFFPVESTKGFLPSDEISEKTELESSYGFDSFYTPTSGDLSEFVTGRESGKKYKARFLGVRIGKDYHGSLDIPKHTESVDIFDLEDGRQVIWYNHWFLEDNGTNYRIFPFANEMRSKDKRVEIQDLVPEEKLTFDRLASEEKAFVDSIRNHKLESY
jgi:hypothetical protein